MDHRLVALEDNGQSLFLTEFLKIIFLEEEGNHDLISGRSENEPLAAVRRDSCNLLSFS